MQVVDTQGPAPETFEACKDGLCAIVQGYLNYDGLLPYNGFSSLRFTEAHTRAQLAVLGHDPEDVAVVHNVQMFGIVDAVLAEHCRVWMELSGVQDVTHSRH
jgi:hypothetical protein